MKTVIYYFTGTGNSLFVAKELQKLIPETELIPIAEAIKSHNYITKGKAIGFVFPCHGLTIPLPVRTFLKRIDPGSADYFFAIATRGGTIFRGFHTINHFLRKHKKCLNADILINMGLNDPKLKFFTDLTADELDLLEESVLHELKKIQSVVINKETNHDVLLSKFHPRYFPMLFEELMILP